MKKNNDINLEINIGGIKLKNPVMPASGTFGYGLEFEKFMDLNKIGAIVTKGLSLKENKGNPPPRLIETKCGILNSIGLQNIGVYKFIKEKLPLLKKYDTKIIANIYGKSIDEYIKVAEILKNRVDGIEINISCPNVKKGGMQFSEDKKSIKIILKEIKKIWKKGVIVKLSPNVYKIEEIAKVCEDSGADALSLINTVLGMAVNIKTKKPYLSNIYGGLSGPAIKPIAIYNVYKVSQIVNIPIIGIGGITDYKDALEFFIVGASAVQIGTYNFVNPKTIIKIINDIKKYMKKENIKNIKNIIKSLKTEKL